MKEFLKLTPDNLDREMVKFELALDGLHLNVRDGVSLIRALEAYYAMLSDQRGDTHKPAVAELIERFDKEILNVTGWEVAG